MKYYSCSIYSIKDVTLFNTSCTEKTFANISCFLKTMVVALTEDELLKMILLLSLQSSKSLISIIAFVSVLDILSKSLHFSEVKQYT